MPQIDAAAGEAYSYVILVDDNFDYQNIEKRYKHSEHTDSEAALQAAKAIVDLCLGELHKPGMTDVELYSMYTSFGEDPFVQTNDPGFDRFSAWTYAKERCAAICGEPGVTKA